MNRLSQGLVMGFFGGVLARMALSDVYLRYVAEWMKWPIVVSGVLLAALGLGLLISSLLVRSDGTAVVPDQHAHGVPAVTWLLVLPGMMFFLVSPPELGSYLAERRAGEAVAAPEPPTVVPLGDGQDVIPVDLVEFVWRAQDGGESLEEHTVSVKGFVSYDDDGNWYATQMVISCCAADATAYQIRIEGAEAPARDQWVRVTGTYVTGTGAGGRVAPALAVTEVKEISAPRQTYG